MGDCNLCDYQSVNKDDLNKHVELRHTDCDIYRCYLCRREIEKKNGFVRHGEKVHQKEYDGQFMCPLCWKVYFTQADKDEHSCHGNHGRRSG